MTTYPHYPWHHDDEYLDEIRITTVPRFKTSDLSGDEWRTSAVVEILRKGIIMRIKAFHSVREAIQYMGSIAGFAPADYDEDEPGWLGMDNLTGDLCGQPGCAETAAVEYHKVKESCREGHVKDISDRDYRVKWCDSHRTRGDSSLDDCDDNYEPFRPL